jgi:hypothetical protein
MMNYAGGVVEFEWNGPQRGNASGEVSKVEVTRLKGKVVEVRRKRPEKISWKGAQRNGSQQGGEKQLGCWTTVQKVINIPNL